MARKILEPIEINGMKLKNRIGCAPNLHMPVNKDGSVSDETERLYETKAQTGAGLIMTGTLEVLPPEHVPGAAAVRQEAAVACLMTSSYRVGRNSLRKFTHTAQNGSANRRIWPMSGESASAAPYPDPFHAKLSS